MSQHYEEKTLENSLPLLLETIEEDDAKLDVEGEHLLLTNTHNTRSKAVKQTAVETSRSGCKNSQIHHGDHGCGVCERGHGGDNGGGVHGGVPSAT